MSTGRRNAGIDDAADPLVSQAYRDITGQTSPERLDRMVLAKAQAATKPRYRLWVMWLRPVSWAVTIGLCLAIVIELTRQTQPDDELFDGPSDELFDIPPATRSVPELRIEGASLIQEAQERARLQSGSNKEPVLAPSYSGAGDPVLEEHTAESEPVNRALQANPAMIDADGSCSESVTRSPATWLSCIEALEASGREAMAELERKRLHDAFPDFDLP